MKRYRVFYRHWWNFNILRVIDEGDIPAPVDEDDDWKSCGRPIPGPLDFGLPPFPFEEFNGIPDDEINDAVEDFFLRLFRENREACKRALVGRKKAKQESIAERQKCGAAKPPRRPSLLDRMGRITKHDSLDRDLKAVFPGIGDCGDQKLKQGLAEAFVRFKQEAVRELSEGDSVFPPRDPACFGRFNGTLGTRLAFRLGYTDQPLPRFGWYSPSPMEDVPKVVNDEDEAERAVERASRWFGKTLLDGDSDLYGLKLHFGYRSKEVDDYELLCDQMRAERVCSEAPADPVEAIKGQVSRDVCRIIENIRKTNTGSENTGVRSAALVDGGGEKDREFCLDFPDLQILHAINKHTLDCGTGITDTVLQENTDRDRKAIRRIRENALEPHGLIMCPAGGKQGRVTTEKGQAYCKEHPIQGPKK